MTLDQLRTLQTVARLGSFTRAAAELGLTQPAVSAQIRALERDLGVRPFVQIGKRVAVSEAGRILLGAADEILQRTEEVREELRELEGLQRGRIRIGASLVVGVYLLPDALIHFKKTFPKLDLSLEIEPARHVVEKVLAGEVDVGVIGEGAPLADQRLVITPFAKDELVVIVGRDHPWAKRSGVPASSLENQPFIVSDKGSAIQELVSLRLGEAGVRLQVVMELGNIEAIKRAVEAGLGISIVSRGAIVRDVKEHHLQALRVTGVSLKRNLSFVTREGKRLSRISVAFMDSLKKHRFASSAGR